MARKALIERGKRKPKYSTRTKNRCKRCGEFSGVHGASDASPQGVVGGGWQSIDDLGWEHRGILGAGDRRSEHLGEGHRVLCLIGPALLAAERAELGRVRCGEVHGACDPSGAAA